MRKCVFFAVMLTICSAASLSAEEDDIWVCQGGNATICSQAYVRCVGQYGGQMDPGGSGLTLCEAKYQTCLESGGGCYPVY